MDKGAFIMSFDIIRQDITRLKVDAIVNASNTKLIMGGGASGAISRTAGEKDLQSACDALAPISIGQAVITSGFNLPAKYIIHVAAPIYGEGKGDDESRLLSTAYKSSLELAQKYSIESIAFPLISSGVFGYPKEEALEITVATIKEFLKENEMKVSLVVYDKSTYKVSEKLIRPVESYIDDKYIDKLRETRRNLVIKDRALIYEEQVYPFKKQDLKIDEKLKKPFSQMLLELIDKKNKTDVEVYKKANIDRKLFSKIRAGKGYLPSKKTILALAIGMELSLKETDELLERAGYSLSHAFKFDVIVEYFIINERYDIFEINQVLFEYDEPLLGN